MVNYYQHNELIFSTFTNTKENKMMNKTINSFSTIKKFKNIPVLASFECQPSDFEFKFNKTNYKNRIESINNKSSKKLKLKSDINQHKMLNEEIIYSLKRYNLGHNKNNINILKFNSSISNTPNNDFHGKKILLSKNPLLLRNKFMSNNKKNIEINSSLFNDKVEDEKNIYSFEGKFNSKLIYKSGDFFSTKIENELKNIWNKQKNDNTDNNLENSKQVYISKNKNKYLNTITNFNKTKINYLQTEGDLLAKKNKMKIIKTINNKNNNTISLINKNININSNFINKYINPDNMLRKVVYIDQSNKTLSHDKTLNLLKEEKDFIYANINDILLSYYIDDKGNLINIPFNNKNLKLFNGNFLTEFGNKKFGHKDESNEKSNRKGKLGKLIADRFTKTNYRNITPSRMKSSQFEINYHKNYDNEFNNNYPDKSAYNNYNTNSQNIDNGSMHSNNIFRKIITNSNNFPVPKRKKKDKKRDSVLNDILGVIKSKVISSPYKKQNQNDVKKEENKDLKRSEKGKFVRSGIRAMSRLENYIPDFNYSNKFFGGEDNKLNSILFVKDSKGKTIKVNFIKKQDDMLTPINEEGQVIKDMRILNNIYEITKKYFNSEAEKKLFQKRYSLDVNALFKNPLIALSDKENRTKVNDMPTIVEENINNKIFLNKIKEDKNKEKMDKKEREQKNNKLLINLPKNEKKATKVVNKFFKIKTKSNIKKSINAKNKNNNITAVKNNNSVNENLNQNIKVEPEIIDPKIKELLNDIKNNPQNEIVYNEEDDFIKDFNFDFYSSSEESEAVTLQKKLRYIRKKQNKHLFSIFNFIAKNTDFSKDFTKEDLIKYLLNQDFKFNFEQLKEQITKGRILSYKSLYTNGINTSKIHIKDLEIINYLYRYIEDKDSIFYRAIYHPKNQKNKKEPFANSYNGKLNLMLDQKKIEELKKHKRFSVFHRKPTKEFLEDKYKINKKKFEKKKKPQIIENEIITNSEKKLLMLNEINLTNELKYQISISNDKESREKFKNLLNKIEALRNLDSNEYVKSLKRNYEMYKEEVNEIIKAKEIEERLNGFVDSLNYQRNNLKDKHKYITSSLYIKDNKFESTLEHNIND